jgi:hypothetical protein
MVHDGPPVVCVTAKGPGAFRRWTGETPLGYRKRAAAAKEARPATARRR